MSELTKEWLQQKIADMEAARDEIPFGLDEDDNNTLAALRIALASLEAEAVAYTDAEELRFHHATSDMWPVPLGHGMDLPLYAAPPAPVSVPDDVMAAMQKVARIRLDLNDFDGDKRGILDCLSDAEEVLIGVVNCRAAMLHGAENAESRCTIQTAPALDSSPKIAKSRCSNSPVIPGCSCRTCRPVTMTDMRFVVCPECGNKRCPHANGHRHECTGSNEPGQEGSAYPAAPQQEVK
ncbi:hypothetical protein [Enterobacter wuhouensis]|uniref:hypothetical protein n=1 Tax=Enterobacter wuhouensis TaxID=2529381 RepID=UPI0035242A15